MRKRIRPLAALLLATAGLHASPLTFTREGKGPAVLFVHGYAGNHGVWKDVASRLKQDRTVVCVDLPGSGKSGAPVIRDGKVDFDAIASELAALVRRQKLEPCLIVGHSMGGPLAALAVLKDPSAFRGLVVVDSFFSAIPEDFAEKVVRDLETYKAEALRSYLGPHCKGKAQEDRIVKDAMLIQLPVLQAYYRAMTSNPVTGRQAELKLPVVVFSAGPEETDPAKRQAMLKAYGFQGIADFRIVPFPGSRHWLMWDEPEAFVKALLEFDVKPKP